MAADVGVEGIRKTYGDVVAVDDVDLTVGDGEFFTLLGPSGSGKTTTLRIIAGFEQPDRGRVTLGGEDITRRPPYARDVNTVFQDYALFPHMTVEQNVAYGLKVKGVKRSERVSQVREVLRMVRLDGYGARKPVQLSGGQRQRVALARSIVNRPQVLLLDEPLGALDLKLRKQMQLELKRIQHELGITFVHVTHDQEEAMTMADGIAVMNRGRIEQLGNPRDLYERPRTAFVAGFLGVSNLLHGVVAAPGVLRLNGGGEVRVDAPLPSPGAEISIGVRPEKLRLAADGVNTLTGTVAERAYIGVSTQYVVDTTAGAVTVYVQNVQEADAAAEPGRSVTLSWDPGSSFVLDPREG